MELTLELVEEVGDALVKRCAQEATEMIRAAMNEQAMLGIGHMLGGGFKHGELKDGEQVMRTSTLPICAGVKLPPGVSIDQVQFTQPTGVVDRGASNEEVEASLRPQIVWAPGQPNEGEVVEGAEYIVTDEVPIAFLFWSEAAERVCSARFVWDMTKTMAEFQASVSVASSCAVMVQRIVERLRTLIAADASEEDFAKLLRGDTE